MLSKFITAMAGYESKGLFLKIIYSHITFNFRWAFICITLALMSMMLNSHWFLCVKYPIFSLTPVNYSLKTYKHNSGLKPT